MRMLAAAVLIMLWSPVILGQAQPEGALPPSNRFTGSVQVRAKDGRAVSLRVSLRNWSLRGTRAAQAWSEPGFVVMQLLAGTVRTTIDGKTQQRREGEFWSAREGTTMTVEVIGEMATLQSLTVVTP